MPSATAEPATTTSVQITSAQAASNADTQQLADTGSIDTTPYLIGGTAFLGMGAALVMNATRRARTGTPR